MTSKTWGKATIALAILMVGFSSLAFAQAAQSNIAQIDLTAHLNESLTLTVNSGTDIDFTLLANTAVNSGNLTTSVTTAWVLKPSRAAVQVWAYFGTAAAAMNGTAGNLVTIPGEKSQYSNLGFGILDYTMSRAAGQPYEDFMREEVFLKLGLTHTSVGLGNNKNSNRTDVLAYQIDTTVVPQLPADDYAGVMNIQAQAN